jgi:hypothetical protein
MTMNEEVIELLPELWRERAETYERLGHEDEADQVRMCAFELESWIEDNDE